MDESNINFKFYEALKQECNENLFLSLIDIDTCSLQYVHGAIRSCVETTFWGLRKPLQVHFICCMTPQPDLKVLKLSQVQTSIHSFFELQGVSKAK